MKQYINRSGYKQSFLAGKLGITRQSFNSKVNGKAQFSAAEAVMLSTLLGVDTVDDFRDIFLPDKFINHELS